MTIEININSSDGNAFLLIGKIANLMEKAKRPKREIEKWEKEATSCNSYQELLRKVQVKCVRLSYHLDEDVRLVSSKDYEIYN